MNEKNKNRLFWLISLLIPLFVFLMLEMALYLGGYEEEKQDLFVDAPNTPDYLIGNSKFTERYFPVFAPGLAPNVFRENKLPNTFRVFVFGGSSAKGFPYNFYTGFADQLEQLLILNTQGLHVEIINLGMTAVNSYIIRDLAKRVLPYEPDAVIIYAGHNEYYGSFGAATTQFGLTNLIALKRLILWLKDWRVYQMLENLLLLDSLDQDIGERRTMMSKVINESDIPIDSKIYLHGIQQFRKNIKEAVQVFEKESIPVFIGTVASNIKDQPPLSEEKQTLELFKQAEYKYDQGLFDEAASLYMQSKELDGTRFRAPEEINKAITNITKETKAILVPVKTVLKNKSKSGIEDSSLFIDHLHPNDIGHKYIAETFFNHISSLNKIQTYFNSNSLKTPNKISSFEKTFAETKIARLLAGYPFKKNITIEDELDIFDKFHQSNLNKNYIDSVASITARDNKPVPTALIELINESTKRKDTSAVLELSYDLLKWQLNSIDLIESTIEFTFNSGEKEGYLFNILHQVINDGNLDPRYFDLLASLYLLNENTKQARYWLIETERKSPEAPRLLYNFSRYYYLMGDTLKAQEYFQQFVKSQLRS